MARKRRLRKSKMQKKSILVPDQKILARGDSDRYMPFFDYGAANKIDKDTVFCFGDSHISTLVEDFEGLLHETEAIKGFLFERPVVIQRCRSWLAYNLLSKEPNFSSIDFAEKTIVLGFGEVDCRVYAVKQKNVDEITENYIKFARNLKERGSSKIVFLAPHCAPLLESQTTAEMPVVGSLEERKEITRVFAKNLIKSEFDVMSLVPYLCDRDGKIKKELFLDDVHLDKKKVRPFLKKEFRRVGLS